MDHSAGPWESPGAIAVHRTVFTVGTALAAAWLVVGPHHLTTVWEALIWIAYALAFPWSGGTATGGRLRLAALIGLICAASMSLWIFAPILDLPT